MATWQGLSRSNYFRVKNDEAFKADMATTHAVVVVHGKLEHAGKFAVYANEDGDWPSDRYDEVSDSYHEVDFVEVLQGHLADGEVCVLMTAGHEAARYATGYAQAFRNAGEVVEVSLDDIYAKAREAFGITPNAATY